MKELYEEVTTFIIDRLLQIEETGDSERWLTPWKGTDVGVFPINMFTNAHYTGINVLLCWMASMHRGFPCNKWMTFKQMLQYGADNNIELSVKGEKGTKLIRVIEFKPKDSKPDDPYLKRSRSFTVFNASQIAGLTDYLDFSTDTLTPITHEYAHTFAKATQADIRDHPNQAFYATHEDYIGRPPLDSFLSEELYIATLFHELGHWTGHKSRLDRDQTGTKRSKEYAYEELVAEITSAFFAQHFGLDGKLQHAEYLHHYINILKSDSTIIKTASADAQKAYEHLHSLQPTALDIAV